MNNNTNLKLQEYLFILLINSSAKYKFYTTLYPYVNRSGRKLVERALHSREYSPITNDFGSDVPSKSFLSSGNFKKSFVFIPFVWTKIYAEPAQNSLMYPPKDILEKLLESPTLGEHTRLFIEHLLHIERLQWAVDGLIHHIVGLLIYISIYIFIYYGKKTISISGKSV
ncbi:unnamed protein product (mitochondrion) [Parajaminaea phylloscopi]|uniref:Uncharacterized protein n=1 Tax=Parajaminaea phylloscopi TaxID=1463510 RepID=A0AB39A6X7_9BASI